MMRDLRLAATAGRPVRAAAAERSSSPALFREAQPCRRCPEPAEPGARYCRRCRADALSIFLEKGRS